MTPCREEPRAPRAQRGAVLLIALVLLGMMLLLSVSAMDSSLVQEKMSANTRDRFTAFESNEASVRNGFDYRRQLIVQGRPLPDNSTGYYCSAANGIHGCQVVNGTPEYSCANELSGCAE